MDSNIYSKNIIFSGWPASGSSTQARIFALLFDMHYLYAGGVLKYWAKSMGYDPKTNALNEWIEKYGKYWDQLWDRFILDQFNETQQTVIDTKILGFFVKKPKSLTEIFLTASLQERIKRAKSAIRSENIQERDDQLKKEWKQKYNINIFDEKLIRENYDYVVDTTNLDIREVAQEILSFLVKDVTFNLEERLNDIINNYSKDNEYMNKELEKRGKYITPQKIIEVIKKSKQYAILRAEMPTEIFEI